jgi:hypothetical protein
MVERCLVFGEHNDAARFVAVGRPNSLEENTVIGDQRVKGSLSDWVAELVDPFKVREDLLLVHLGQTLYGFMNRGEENSGIGIPVKPVGTAMRRAEK